MGPYTKLKCKSALQFMCKKKGYTDDNTYAGDIKQKIINVFKQY